MSSSPSASSTPVKRACDSCHRRKVKCIGEGTKPCKNCISAGLNCTYNAIPQKKGPKGSRAKVLSELRENQRQSQLSPGSQYDLRLGSRSISPVAAHARTPGLLTPETLDSCVEYFFANIYPTQPILHQGRVQQTITQMNHSIEAYCKMVSLCAYVLFQPTMVLQSNARPAGDFAQNSNVGLAHILLEEAIRVRKGYEFSESPTILAVYTSFFIFSSYFCMDRQNAAWVYLRQATTLAHIMGMHEEETYKADDFVDSSRKRRLFWVLFMTERAYAFKRHRPLTLYDTIQPPIVDEDPTESVPLSGFIHLIKLYKPFDETFFGLWNRTRHGAVPSWLVSLQRQLSDALPSYIESTEIQAVELKMSQQWLKTMVWQLAISHGFISSVASDNTLSFRYPIEISRDLVEMSNDFSQHAMEVHGISLVEKLFDVACTLIDVMSCVPLSPAATYEMSPRDYLNRFISLISSLCKGQSRYLPLLQTKLSEVLPNYQLPLHLSLQPSLQPSLSSNRLDIYGDHSQSASTPRSNEATPFETPPPMAIRQHIPGMSYQDGALSTIQRQMSETSAYPSFSSSMVYPETTTGPVVSDSGLYQTHLPRRPGYPG